MSVTMTKADGVTVLTLTSDPQSAVPPICQILKSLCYSPVCCSVSQHLKKIQGASQSALGALQIMIGLLNIGLGAILTSSGAGSWWQMDSSLFPFWIGGLFIFFGAMSILSEKCPSPCLVILNVILSVSGVAFAIAAIVLYSINIAHIYMWWECEQSYYDGGYDYDDFGNRHRRTTPPPSSEQIRMKEKCLEAQNLALMLLRSINAVLIVLSVMALCITLSSAILGIKALRRREKGENKSNGDPELYKPLLEEVTSNPAA
ncbi:transmembrane protein 176B-like [Notolabrus celidotus]|uniref:transmembrane protein 176B-like n=1 Tax=Notolabrus celidotus TaxID=1203425 RepID=UPI00148FF73F|nr:transmembrane protein 176B-like [Notolabrus celidotus]